MSFTLPLEGRKKSVPEPETACNIGLLADDFFQPRGRCPPPSAVSERAILGLEHCKSAGHAMIVARSPLSSEDRHAWGTDDTLERAGMGAKASRNLAATLPTELLHMIFRLLGPTDFEAARKVFDSWYFASLYGDILVEQLKRGGWWTMASIFSEVIPGIYDASVMSFLTARECRLSGRRTWRESRSPDIDDRQDNFEPSSAHNIPGEGDHLKNGGSAVCATSLCGRYFLDAWGSNVYAYEIERGKFDPICRISCEKRVLAMTISVNTHHFAIAALLEGRIGVYVDLMDVATPASSILQ